MKASQMDPNASSTAKDFAWKERLAKERRAVRNYCVDICEDECFESEYAKKFQKPAENAQNEKIIKPLAYKDMD